MRGKGLGIKMKDDLKDKNKQELKNICRMLENYKMLMGPIISDPAETANRQPSTLQCNVMYPNSSRSHYDALKFIDHYRKEAKVLCLDYNQNQISDLLHFHPHGFVQNCRLTDGTSLALEEFIRPIGAASISSNGLIGTNIKIKDIRFIEKQNNYLEVHGVNTTYRIHQNMNPLADELKEWGFIRTSEAHLVNLRYIKRITKTQVILKQGLALPKSSARTSEIKNRLLQYAGKGLQS